MSKPLTPHSHLPAARLARLGRAVLACAALLVPLAQGLAAWHTTREGVSERSAPSDPPSFQHTNCDLCLTAAALSGSAGPPALVAPALQAARHEAPLPVPRGASTAPDSWHYRSRAPPIA